MIGRMDFTHDGREHSATLAEDGSWEISPPLPASLADPALASLDRISDDYGGPSEGPFGPIQLARAASVLNGTYAVEPKIPDPPGTLY